MDILCANSFHLFLLLNSSAPRSNSFLIKTGKCNRDLTHCRRVWYTNVFECESFHPAHKDFGSWVCVNSDSIAAVFANKWRNTFCYVWNVNCNWRQSAERCRLTSAFININGDRCERSRLLKTAIVCPVSVLLAIFGRWNNNTSLRAAAVN